MKHPILSINAFFFCAALLLACAPKSNLAAGATRGGAQGIAVPLGGNAYLTQLAPGSADAITKNGLTHWSSSETIASVYLRLGRPGLLSVGLKGSVPSGSSTIRLRINGSSFTVALKGQNAYVYPAGTVVVADTGYVKIDLQGISRSGPYFANVYSLIVGGAASAEKVLFASDPENFYWSRRGPSVHLGYAAPAGTHTEWFYNELTVSEGEDKIGSYFMSNGFGEGYFGIQVNSAAERRVLFSVWDPPKGKTTLVRKAKEVTTNNFGGEGTGGQSYLVYPWKAGTTYKFLTQGRPDSAGSTVYASWFYAPERGRWQFIAAWKRPNTSTYLTRLHSFLENFLDTEGWQERQVRFTNQWACSSAGTWAELTTARFTADATAKNEQRKDYAGGVSNGQFFLRNGGFFADFVHFGTMFTRPATGRHPDVDLAQLP